MSGKQILNASTAAACKAKTIKLVVRVKGKSDEEVP